MPKNSPARIIKEDDEKLRAVIESVPSGIIITDLTGRIVLCNTDAAKMFGYERADLIGQLVELLVPLRYKERHPAERNQFAQHPQKRQMGAGRDLTGLHKDGSEIPVEIGLNPVHLPEGNFILASVANISERKAIESKLHLAYQALQQKNDEMEQFVYTVSHDLKAPLVTSASFLGFLREDIEAKRFADVEDSLGRLDRAQKRMQELINDLLQLSRIGRLSLEIEQFALAELLHEICDNSADSIKAKKIVVQIAEDLPVLRADRSRIQQVCENLLSNAFKYAADVPEPRVSVFCEETPNYLNICVKDNGPGIDPQYHKKIFGLFQRLATDNEGTGVGLTIVSRIMQLHGGTAWVESQIGKGAEFWISFPKSNAAVQVGIEVGRGDE